MGALQTAIENAGLNDAFKNHLLLNEFSGYNNPQASGGSQQTASPGYLVQSDLLSGIGNALTVRDDTFTIRAYGQISDPSGTKIESRAWCEAVVQRSIEYVDPANEPEVPSLRVNPSTGALTEGGLTATNKAFGRKFRILSFRWLSPDEV